MHLDIKSSRKGIPNRELLGGASGTRTRDPLLAKQMRYQLRHSPFRAKKPIYRYFQTPGSLRKSFAAFSAQAIITPINSSFKIFFKSTYLVDCNNKLPSQWA